MYKKNIRNLYKIGGFGGPLIYGHLLAVVMLVLTISMLKSNLKKIPLQNIYMNIKENSILPCQTSGFACVLMENFHLTQVESWQNQVRSHLGLLAHFSFEHMFLQEFLKEGKISSRLASPPNRASSPPYEQFPRVFRLGQSVFLSLDQLKNFLQTLL